MGPLANARARWPGALSPGIRAMVLGAFFFSLMSLFVKLAGARIPTPQIVLVRGVLSLTLAYAMLRRARVDNWGHRKGLLVLRGLVGFTALSCFYFALVRLPLADATVIQYTSPVWTAWFSWLVLGERAGRRETALSLASLLGVLLIARPSFLFGSGAALQPLAVAVALLGAVFSATAYVSVRKLGETEHPLVIVFYFTAVTVPAALPGLALGAVWPTPLEWLWLLGVGVTAVLGQLYLTRGLQLEPAGRATTAGYVQIVFAALWGALFFAELPDLWSLAGTLLILACVLAIGRQRARAPAAAEQAQRPYERKRRATRRTLLR